MFHVEHMKKVFNFIWRSAKIISREIICKEVVTNLNLYIAIILNVSRETYKGSIYFYMEKY